MNKLLYIIILLSIISISFLLYSSARYPLLSSDDAINILMAHYYGLPDDLYSWGQDRGGGSYPLLARLL